MRSKVWRSNKDKQLHLISAEGAEAFAALPVSIRNLGPWTGSKEGDVDRLRLPLRILLNEQGSRSCTATSRSWRWRMPPTTRCIQQTPIAQIARAPAKSISMVAYVRRAAGVRWTWLAEGADRQIGTAHFR